jgi:hypothetical protein
MLNIVIIINVLGSDTMNKTMSKVISFQEYKNNKKSVEVNRDELLKLIKKIATVK